MYMCVLRGGILTAPKDAFDAFANIFCTEGTRSVCVCVCVCVAEAYLQEAVRSVVREGNEAAQLHVMQPVADQQ